jgi:hypothetical protein
LAEICAAAVTGVTLPFISYGGSSLLTSFIALLILLLISNHQDEEPAPLPKPQPYFALGVFLSVGLFAAALTNGWWAVVRGPDLLTRGQPAPGYRTGMCGRTAGPGQSHQHQQGNRHLSARLLPDLAPVSGMAIRLWTIGAEAPLDDYLRSGQPAGTIWWNHLLYGMSPAGNVRLSPISTFNTGQMK